MRAAWVLGFAIAASAASAADQRWEFVAASSDKRTFVSIDRETLINTGGTVVVWVSYLMLPEVLDNTFTKDIQRTEINCRAMTSTILAAVEYDKDGRPIPNAPGSRYPLPMQPIVPDSLIEGVWKAVCK